MPHKICFSLPCALAFFSRTGVLWLSGEAHITNRGKMRPVIDEAGDTSEFYYHHTCAHPSQEVSWPLHDFLLKLNPFLRSQVKNYSSRYMEQAPSRGRESSPHWVRAAAVLQQQKLRGLSARAQAWRINISPSFSALGVSSFLSPPRSAMRRGAWKCNTGSR